MNVKIDIDITPEEMRRLFGLPDLEPFHRQVLEDVRQRMLEGAEGYDPVKFFQPYVTGTLASWDMFQKMLGVAGAGAAAGQGGSKKE